MMSIDDMMPVDDVSQLYADEVEGTYIGSCDKKLP